MRAFFRTVGIFIAVIICLGAVVHFARLNAVDEPSTYTIKYRAIQNGKLTDIYPTLWKEEGNYPTQYTSGEVVTIDDLKEIVSVSAYEDRSFLGWYLDSACTEEFNGTITAKDAGDLTLYAKIDVAQWTPNF